MLLVWRNTPPRHLNCEASLQPLKTLPRDGLGLHGLATEEQNAAMRSLVQVGVAEDVKQLLLLPHRGLGEVPVQDVYTAMTLKCQKPCKEQKEWLFLR